MNRELIETLEDWAISEEAKGQTHRVKTLREAIAALTPVEDEEVESMMNRLSMKLDLDSQDSRDLIGRLATDNSYQAHYITELQQRIEELTDRISDYKHTIECAKAQIAEYEKALEQLQDQLKNGIKYDEETNHYVLVWTEKQIQDAQREAGDIYERIRRM